MRLTQARIAMLRQLAGEPGYYADYYPPMKWALENDYAEETKGGFFTLTVSGRSLLADVERSTP